MRCPYSADLRISIHAPHTRSDGRKTRGAWKFVTNFNPRSSYEERQQPILTSNGTWISIHAPHTRSDSKRARARSCLIHFNPRSSYEERRGAITYPNGGFTFQSTLLIRGATHKTADSLQDLQFQSTLLIRGATTTRQCIYHCATEFQSTLLIRGATCLS